MSTQPCSQSIPNDTCVTRIRDWQTWLLTSYTTTTKTNIAVIFALSRDLEWRHRLQCADENWLKKKRKESVFGCKLRTNDKQQEWTIKTLKVLGARMDEVYLWQIVFRRRLCIHFSSKCDILRNSFAIPMIISHFNHSFKGTIWKKLHLIKAHCIIAKFYFVNIKYGVRRKFQQMIKK